MTTTIVPETITEVEVDALKAQWEAACEAQRQAHAANVTKPSLKALDAVYAASHAERVAHDLWHAGEQALVARYSAELAADEEARLEAMCAAYDLLEAEYDGFDDHAYQLTPAGVQHLLDHHYQNSSEVEMLAVGGDSPYEGGEKAIIKPASEPAYYVNGQPDMDLLSQLEDY